MINLKESFLSVHKLDNRTNNNGENLHSLLAFFLPSSAGDAAAGSLH